ncbi:DNA mismatch repair endonuclease MutL [Anaerococcus sp. Marseille-Q5996]|uniref:DNA mismatch repair endonuclease MutL n=1 Tax=Anaerococcus sp. Marseille-Q5996 TaxID=2972769 RepID=UPI0021C64E69|nr:DNA mismatch repair endonuclease MutL [Anaerococcus sp. Marseille-Q5996]
MPIIKLDDRTIEQIAAGEVIESPVSVVKELVENSIDAGAKNIVVEIKKGGKSYIRVTDDGRGIANDQMRLAFEKHTTSKIKDFSDLYDIYSLGFRGEALASIVTVSQMQAISKTENDPVGKKLEFLNTNIEESSIATNNGTSIEVMNLFNNVPVRKKFLKSDLAESNAISKLMYSLAIGYNSLSLKYIKDGRVEFKTNANEPLDIRISNLLDENLKENLIKINSSDSIYKIEGFISSSNYYRGSRNLQYLYVNNRLIDSSLITKVIEKEYKSLIPQGRFPAIFLFLSTNPKNLDVNVHPNKRTIKFNYEDELIKQIEDTVHQALRENISPNSINIAEKKDNSIPDLSNYQNLLDSYSGFNIVREEKASYEEKNDFFDTDKKIDIERNENTKFISKDNIDTEKIKERSFLEGNTFLYLTSMFDRYSLFKVNNNKLYLIDHRRADQAIKFQKYLKNIKESQIVSQILLEPLIINLKVDERFQYESKKDLLASLGFDIEDFGENQIIVRAVPQLFEHAENDSLIMDLIDMDIKEKNEVFYKKLYKLIKETSFRKGHTINKQTAEQLINDLFMLDNPFKSYDGKTVILELEEDTLEKYFDR